MNNTSPITNNVIYKFFIQLFFVLSVLSAVVGFSYYNIGTNFAQSGQIAIENIIEVHETIDLDHMCKLTNCQKIYIPLKVDPSFEDNIFINKNSKLISHGKFNEKICKDSILINGKDFKVTKNLNLMYIDKSNGIIVETNSRENIIAAVKLYVTIILLYIIPFTFVYFRRVYSEQRRKMLELMSTSGTLQEKNMKILTENIHHELNTPVAIIQGMIKQLEYKIISRTKEMGDGNITCDFNFEEVYSSVDQINTVLQRMSNFKHFKYSNGNKSVQDIFKYSANSMNIYKHSNFKIELDPKFKHYSLTGTLGNGDLLNVIGNHFRNSLEAKATKIKVDCNYIPENNTAGLLHIYIIDNGVGIRNKETGLILSTKRLNDVFKPYYSTKDINGESLVIDNISRLEKCWIRLKNVFIPKDDYPTEIRGVGLFLNKQLLLDNDCEVLLRETSEKGTVFEIIIHVKLR